MALAAPVPSTVRPRTILVVDDSSDDLELLAIMFKRSRILNPLQVVNTVADAIHYLKGEGVYAGREAYPFPALVLLDLHLSDGSGFDILSWLQAHQAEAPTIAVVLTGSDAPAIGKAYELGARSFLLKPLKFPDFQGMVEHVHGLTLIHASDGYLLDVEQSFE